MRNRRRLRWCAPLLAVSALLGVGAAASPASPPERGSSVLDRISSVTVAPERIGSLVTRISGPRKSGKVEGGEYVTYRITFANHGHQPLTFVNNKTARFYGHDDGLAIADAGCGFGSDPGGDVEPACQSDLEFIGLDPASPGPRRSPPTRACAGWERWRTATTPTSAGCGSHGAGTSRRRASSGSRSPSAARPGGCVSRTGTFAPP